MDLINDARDFILLITALGAVLGVYINFTNNFFSELIKNKFESVPIKASNFRVMLNLLIGIIYFLNLIYGVVIIKRMVNTKVNFIIWINSISSDINTLVALGIALGVIASLVIIVYLFEYTEKKFRLKLRLNEYQKIKVKFIFMAVVCFIFAMILTIVCGVGVIGALKSKNGNYKELLDSLSLFFLFFTLALLFYNLLELMGSVNEKRVYTIIGTKEYVCKCYIEYGEYYLLFVKGIETYIKKADVKEITITKGII